MPLPQYVIRDYAGGSVPAQLQNEMGPSDTEFSITPTEGWVNAAAEALGTAGPFVVAVDRFTPSEEKILCSSIDLTTGVVQVYISGGDGATGRGYDGSTAQSHVPGGSSEGVQTCWSAVEAAEANAAVFDVLGAGASGAFGVPVGVMVPWSGPRTTVPTNFKVCDGSTVSRTAFAALMAAITIGTTGNVSSGSPNVTVIPSTAVAEMGVGMKIEGLGIPSGATIASILSTTSIQLSANAVGTHTGTALTVFPWGNGDGSTTYNLPDCRGKTPTGANGTGSNASPTYTIGQTGGEQAHTLVTGELATHNHPDSGHTHSHAHGGATGGTSANHVHNGLSGGQQFAYLNGTDGGGGFEGTILNSAHPGFVYSPISFTPSTEGQSADHDHAVTGDATSGTANNAAAGSGTAHNNMQPFFVGNWIVRSN